jgi:hypothetical protein
MAWYTGKTEIAVMAIGDSNIVANAEGGDTPSTRYPNPNVYTYTKAADGAPYGDVYLDWRVVYDNDPARDLDMLWSFLAGVPYIGLPLGGREPSAPQLASSVQQATGITNYLYQSGQGGSSSDDWITGANWTSLLATVPTALASIPGTHTYFDIIYISLGTNDIVLLANTAEQFYTNILALKTLMVAEGWWVPGTTQIIFMDLPRTGSITGGVNNPGAGISYPENWRGLDLVRARLNDRVDMNSSVGLGYSATYPVHHSESAYTDLGIQAAALAVAQIPTQRAVFSIGGSRLSLGGQKLRVHSA